MSKAPHCLHVPALYEESTATLSWEPAEGAAAYELESWFDETFEQAETGKSWADLDECPAFTWEAVAGQEMTWADFEVLSAQGVTWRDLEFEGLTWAETEAKDMSWQEFRKLPVRFTIFRGEGEPCRAPDQGLSWAILDGEGWDWTQFHDCFGTWLDFELLYSKGLTWGQMDVDERSWEQVEDTFPDWYTWERQEPRGLTWSTLEGYWTTWEEREAAGHSWHDLEYLPPDRETHRAHVVDIPLYKKKSTFRVRSLGDSGELSDYRTTPLINNLPRSLKQYKPPCLHVPTLYEGKAAEIEWGDLYGAQKFLLERRDDGGDYRIVFDGAGQPVARPDNKEACPVLKPIWDVHTHYCTADPLPYYTKTAQYRVRAYNTTDASQPLEAEFVTVVPVFYRDAVKRVTVTPGEVLVSLYCEQVTDFEGILLHLKYDSQTLRLEEIDYHKGYGIDLSLGTAAKLAVVADSPGALSFRFTKSGDRCWSGHVSTIRFAALRAATTTIQLY